MSIYILNQIMFLTLLLYYKYTQYKFNIKIYCVKKMLKFC